MSYDNDPHAGRSVGLFMGLALQETGDWEHGEVEVTGRTSETAHLLGAHGGLRAGAVLTMCDNVAGFCAGLGVMPDGWVVSTNLQVRIHKPFTAARLVSRVLRKGRRSIVTSCDVYDESHDLVADGVLTSATLVPEFGVPEWSRPAAIVPPPLDDARSMLDMFGIDESSVLDARPEVRNPWGIVHGGVLATLVDVAVERAATQAEGRPMVTTDVVLHYLSPARVGPVRAITTPVGPQGAGWLCRVELRDEGAEDRVVCMATSTAHPV